MKEKIKFALFIIIICIIATLNIVCGYQEHKEREEQAVERTEIKVEFIENDFEDTKELMLDTESNEANASNNEVSTIVKEVEKEAILNSKPKQEEELKQEEEELKTERLVSLGEFKLTAYCPCSQCCGQWAGGATASGVMPVANHTIAVDTDIIPFGTQVLINGTTYVAEDTGGAINGSRIDIFFDSHQEALNFGVQYAEVFVIK